MGESTKKNAIVTPFQKGVRFVCCCGMVIVLLLVWVGPAVAWMDEPDRQWSGRVVRVVDGDTLRVERNGEEVKIRLQGVDAPEHDQPWGREATVFVRNQVLRQQVTVQGKERDRYGRLVAYVILPNGTNLSHLLLRQGLAWWYYAYSNDHTLEAMEATARQARIGLWSDPDPEPPWEWRHRRR
ncbi:MAG: thermonuclease family protein [Magnetococcales bacterium]|nr:thermonuclease family protein [Magnetococcales bacterium]